MIKPLLHKDLVKLGMHESKQGYSLSKIESDFLKKGIKRGDAIKALKEIDYHKKREALKAQREAEASKKAEEEKAASKTPSEKNTTAQTTKKRTSFWLWIILLALAGIVVYIYFSGMVKFGQFPTITFK